MKKDLLLEATRFMYEGYDDDEPINYDDLDLDDPYDDANPKDFVGYDVVKIYTDNIQYSSLVNKIKDVPFTLDDIGFIANKVSKDESGKDKYSIQVTLKKDNDLINLIYSDGKWVSRKIEL